MNVTSQFFLVFRFPRSLYRNPAVMTFCKYSSIQKRLFYAINEFTLFLMFPQKVS